MSFKETVFPHLFYNLISLDSILAWGQFSGYSYLPCFCLLFPDPVLSTDTVAFPPLFNFEHSYNATMAQMLAVVTLRNKTIFNSILVLNRKVNPGR